MQLQHQPCLHNHHVSFSSAHPKLPYKFPYQTFQKSRNFHIRTIRCSSSKVRSSGTKVRSSGTLDYERIRRVERWSIVSRRIFAMENPELGSASVLNQWENEGNDLTKWEVGRIIKELRKYKKHRRALEVYDWMLNRRERFRLTKSDEAMLIDLIAKVRGVTQAENFFLSLKHNSKDKRIYGALLLAYVQARMRNKAESLFDEMRSKKYATDPLTYNVMMTMYLKSREHDKVGSLVSEMIEKAIPLDIYSYNIWLSSCGFLGSAEKAEEVLERIKQDESIVPNWSTYSTMASIYIKLEDFEKAEEYLKMVEARITGYDRISYHYLLSQYGSIGKKEELYRVWNTYKTYFPRIPHLGYHAMMSSLIRMDDIQSAEKLYVEWHSATSTYDPRIGNLILGFYVKNGDTRKAFRFFDHMIEAGTKPNSSTWEFCAQAHLEQGRISDALSFFQKAFKLDDNSKSWRPKPKNITAFFKACENANDMASKEVLLDLLNKSGFLGHKVYASYCGLPHDVNANGLDSATGQQNENTIDDESEMLLPLESGL